MKRAPLHSLFTFKICLACSDDRECFKNSTGFNLSEFKLMSFWYPNMWREGMNKEKEIMYNDH